MNDGFIDPMDYQDIDDFISAIEKSTTIKSATTTMTKVRPSPLTFATKIDRNT